MPIQESSVETFKPGEKVVYTGEYALVDTEGNKMDYEYVTLEEGDNFPLLEDAQNKNLSYTLNDTCDEDDDQCEVIGEPTPDID